jgi:ribosomal protein S12 methylthiotransferase accessory factor
MSRAITEAAQSRLSMINGAREDNFPEDYYSNIVPVANASARRIIWTSYFNADCQLTEVTLRLRKAGIDEVIVLDLSHPEIGIPVVKVFVPSLAFK